MTSSRPSGSECAASAVKVADVGHRSGAGHPSGLYPRLDRRVQRWIHHQGWRQLHDFQERAGHEILAEAHDVIIAAPTAGGKTEAAAIPIASRLAEIEGPGVRCLMVSPLKALINDQARRLEPLFAAINAPLTPWHGDVAASHKKRLLRRPEGVLLITPESLEALMIRHGPGLARLVGNLRYVVIDELHAFMGNERGMQLQSLLHRLERCIGKRVPRVALSATLGDMDLAAEYLRPGEGAQASVIESAGGGQQLRMQIRGYVARGISALPHENEACEAVEVSAFEMSAFEAIAEHIYRHLRGSNNLVFAGSRAQVEKLADRLRQRCAEAHVPNEFLPHHGNLSKPLREQGEKRLRDNQQPSTLVATTTLELGINIGNVATVAQLGTPPSVASMRQRLGRSGRSDGAPAVMRGYVSEEALTDSCSLWTQLRLELVQTIAMVELMLQHWCEPARSTQLHLSTLVQQLLSLIAQHGGVMAKAGYQLLCQTGPFRGVDSKTFASLLHALGQRDLIIQTPGGALVLGRSGEQLVDHYTFYAAFSTPTEFRVVHGGDALGSMPVQSGLVADSFVIFAGRRWRVLSVDERARVIEVAPARGGRVPRWSGSGALVHRHVRREMLRVYAGDDSFAYLDKIALSLLAQGRSCFARCRLDTQRLMTEGNDVVVVPWSGDRGLHTLALCLQHRGALAAVEFVGLRVRNSQVEQVRHLLRSIAHGQVPSAKVLAKAVANKVAEKHHRYLTEELLCADFAGRALDVAAGVEAAAYVLGQDASTPARTN